MSLIKIEYGSIASSSDMNNNFNYLEDLIESLKGTITDKTAGFSSTVQTLSQNVEQLLTYKTSFIQTGMIVPTLSSDIPSGFLLCDGSEVKVSDFEDLYNVIGKLYTSSDSTLFKLPDLRDRVLWGTSSTSTLGQELEAKLPNITGRINHLCTYGSGISGAFKAVSSSNWKKSGVDQTLQQRNIQFDASNCSAIYNNDCKTVQPPAVVVNYLIKY